MTTNLPPFDNSPWLAPRLTSGSFVPTESGFTPLILVCDQAEFLPAKDVWSRPGKFVEVLMTSVGQTSVDWLNGLNVVLRAALFLGQNIGDISVWMALLLVLFVFCIKCATHFQLASDPVRLQTGRHSTVQTRPPKKKTEAVKDAWPRRQSRMTEPHYITREICLPGGFF